MIIHVSYQDKLDFDFNRNPEEVLYKYQRIFVVVHNEIILDQYYSTECT